LKKYTIHLKGLGPRPAYYLIAEQLWGAGRDIDSDGNSSSSEDTEWTELTLSLRGEDRQHLEIDPLPSQPLVLAVRSSQESLARRAAEFIVSVSGGSLEADA